MIELPNQPGFSLRLLAPEELDPLWNEHWPRVFGGKPALNLDQVLTSEEKDSIKRLRGLMGAPPSVRYGLFHGADFVGWHVGEQTSATEFYMRNSAILPSYRRRGLYSALLRFVVDDVTAKGFQLIKSRHTAVNNAIIIAKLKLGFSITGVELSDVFGALVNLTYVTNPKRRKILAFRCGEEQADDDIRRWLGLTP